jgi:hypothetical protein
MHIHPFVDVNTLFGAQEVQALPLVQVKHYAKQATHDTALFS